MKATSIGHAGILVETAGVGQTELEVLKLAQTVLVVLVPEWMAGGALFGFREGRQGSELPAPSGAWKRLPELRLASLSLAELRQLAHECGMVGYGRQNRQELTARLLRRLKARP